MKEIKLIRKTDIIVICVILLAAVLLFIPGIIKRNEKPVAQIYVDGSLKHEVKLDEVTDKIEFEENGTLIIAENSKIRFETSNCKDKICVNSGWISSPAQTAACIPNKVVIVISGSQNQIDALTY
ncbi:MAG: NusG domain II-containing protein [Clostridia bacterium]|nr:NusG domain II-containing protein [Clostridia bacterium]